MLEKSLPDTRLVQTVVNSAFAEWDPGQQPWRGSIFQKDIHRILKIPLPKADLSPSPPPPRALSRGQSAVSAGSAGSPRMGLVLKPRGTSAPTSKQEKNVIDLLGIGLGAAEATPGGSGPPETPTGSGVFDFSGSARRGFASIKKDVEKLLLGLPDIGFMLSRKFIKTDRASNGEQAK